MEPNDTLLTATPANIDASETGEFTFNGEIGDNPEIGTAGDIDLYTLELSPNTRVTFDLNVNNSDSSLEPILRVFDVEGSELVVNDGFSDVSLGFLPPAAGTYYVGVSGFANFEYDPTVAGSGSGDTSTGNYELVITTSDFEADGFVSAAQLLKDIRPNDDPYTSDSYASDFTTFDGKLFFIANDGTTGDELWISDSTTEGTQLLKDIRPGDDPYASSAYISNFTEFDGQLLFTANDGTTGDELWVTDGTADGTQLLKDIRPGDGPYASSSYASDFTEFNGKLLFTANDGTTGDELWVTDGTADGTQLLKDIRPNDDPYDSDSYASDFTEFNGSLLFTANDGTTGDELWVTDGTADGTQLLKDIRPNDGPYDSGSDASDFTELNGKLFFAANDGTTGDELWVTDGTAEGTQLLIDIRPNDDPYNSGSYASDFTELNGRLLFTADDGTTGRGLWVTDGTTEGTQLLKDIDLSSGYNYVSNLTVAGDLLFFTADDGFTGSELWVTDGTSEGTLLFQDINLGADSSFPSNLTVVGDQLLFAADDGQSGNELWAASIPENIITGDADNNTLRGTRSGDFVRGLGGNDVIRGRRGNDQINSGSGDDSVFGGRGKDGIAAGSGNDQVRGGRGDDTLRGDAGNDSVDGGKGDDTVIVTDFSGLDVYDGGAGYDTIQFEPIGERDLTISFSEGIENEAGERSRFANFEKIVAGDGNDQIIGDRQGNTLNGGRGNDELNGEGGRDNLLGGSGGDTLIGGQGDDTLSGGQGNDVLLGECGADTFQFAGELLDGVADTDTIQDFQRRDILDFSAYLEAGGTVEATRVTSGLLRVELSDEDIVNIFGTANALDTAETQLTILLD